ncbi:MAG: glycoside hydrolase family 127 protein [Actinomycetales bacterium]|nr:glycoside hydrolase family 127 protein [Actinomycetales bacterium]
MTGAVDRRPAGTAPVGPVLPTTSRLRPLGCDAVRLTGGFWGERQRRNGEATVPHALAWIDRCGWLDNLRLAARGDLGARAARRGREFSDSEVFKLAEAMAWESPRGGTETLADLSSLIAAAQEPDGYCNTAFGRPGQPPRYSALDFGHELYCHGHLIQAGVAALRTGADNRLGEIAVRAAAHVCDSFGPDGLQGVCGHPGIEMALVELYRVTGTRRYLDQARLFLDRRGHGSLPDLPLGRAYYQDDAPIRRREVFAGHVVRELYLACGAVDVAVETGDDALLATVRRQWQRTVSTRTHLTGGMGSRHRGESFGEDFELPPDRAYAETCAGIASLMLSWRLLLATGEVGFADLAERTLVNVVAAAVALDGRAFFYANPLQQRVPGPPADPARPSPREASGVRAPWYEVACCPTNLARTLASLGAYLATTDDHGIQVHQYAAAQIEVGPTRLEIETAYPWRGRVGVRVAGTGDRPWELSLRVPSWAAGARLETPDGTRVVGPGYARVSRRWRPGDRVRLDLPVRPRWTAADPRIDAVRGCLAVERGPLVYCTESVDVGPAGSVDVGPAGSVDAAPEALLGVDRAAPIHEHPVAGLGEDVVGLTVTASMARVPVGGWPFGEIPVAPRRWRPLTLIPYHLRAHRGPAAMRVWLPAGDPRSEEE